MAKQSMLKRLTDNVRPESLQLPPAFRFSATDVQAAGLWGVTAAVGAVWLIQPFGYIRDLVAGKKEAAEDAPASS